MSKAVTTYEAQIERDFFRSMAERGWHYGRQAPQQLSITLPKGYKAGEIDRLTSSFSTISYTADEHLRRTLRNMRARSRQIFMNDPYAKRFGSALVTNVVGQHGITLQNQAQEIDPGKKDKNGIPLMRFDVGANKAIEAGWEDWGTEGVCDVTGEYSLTDLLGVVVRSVARDGEILINKVVGPEWNKYGLALQLIEGDFLDEQYWNILPNGNRIVMGIEKNPWGKRVAYHFLVNHPGELSYGYSSQSYQSGEDTYSYNGQRYRRVPAENIIHVFVSDRAGQTRGIPWLYAAMLRLQNLSGYEDAAIINARVGASKMGFYKVAGGGDIGGLASSKDSKGTLLDEVEPGTLQRLPDGVDFVEFNPKYPDAEFGPFSKAMLHGIAMGGDVSYSTLSGDLADVNFSSIRSGKIDEQDVYRTLQSWIVRKTLGPSKQKIFPVWLDLALMRGAIRLDNGSALPWAKLEKFNQPTWNPRGFDWVDPQKDIMADILAVNNGFKTRTEVCAERGKDFRDICAQLAEEKRISGEYGLNFDKVNDASSFSKIVSSEGNDTGGAGGGDGNGGKSK